MKIKLMITISLTVIGASAIYLMSRLPEIRGGEGVGPAFFPTLLGLVLLVLSALQTVLSLRRSKRDSPAQVDSEARPEKSFRAWILIAAVLLYALLFDMIGFPVLTFIMILGMGILLERGHIRFKILFSLGFTVFAWIIFRMLLGIPLPSGILSAIL